MDGIDVLVFTTLRESVAIQSVEAPGSPSAEDTSTFQALKLPAATVTSSVPTTFTCFSATFCFCRSKLRKVVV